MARFINPRPQYRPNSKLFFFKSGTNAQLVTYKDQFETTGLENTHPVLTDSAGVVPNIFFSGSAKLVIQDENSVQYGEYDPVGGEKELGDFTLWDSVVTYDKNDLVEGSDGNFYRSLSNGNIGNDPTTSPTLWVEIGFLESWNVNITYSVGDLVKTTTGNLWKSLTATAGNDPETDDGTNWLPAIDNNKLVNSVIPQVVSGTLIANGRINQITDSGSFTMPLASSVADKVILVVELPDAFEAQTPTLTASGSDLFRNRLGTDTSISWIGAARLTLTSNGVDEWSL